jgi:hypothetical protein
MRKIILFLIVIIATGNVYAQRSFRLGLSASPMISWTKPNNKNADKGKVRAGFEYGLIADYMFNDDGNYGMSSGILFSIEGGNVEPIVPFVANNNVRLKYQYIQIPLALKLRTDRFANDKIAVYGNFGGSNNFRIASKADVKIGGITIAENENINKTTSFGTYDVKSRVYDFSLLAGGGIEYFISENTSIIAGFFYNHGFTNIIKDNANNKISLSNFGLRAGVMF